MSYPARNQTAPTFVAAATSPTPLIAEDGLRTELTIVNDDASDDMYLSFGFSGVSSSTYSVKLEPGDIYEAKPGNVDLAHYAVWVTDTAGGAHITATTIRTA